MWPLAAGLPRKAEPKPEVKPEADISDLHGVYVYTTTSPGTCPECGTPYRINDVVVSTGTHPEHKRRIVHINCYQEAA
jgi:hypothetical protein